VSQLSVAGGRRGRATRTNNGVPIGVSQLSGLGGWSGFVARPPARRDQKFWFSPRLPPQFRARAWPTTVRILNLGSRLGVRQRPHPHRFGNLEFLRFCNFLCLPLFFTYLNSTALLNEAVKTYVFKITYNIFIEQFFGFMFNSCLNLFCLVNL
jgi:hypothetical protein